MNLADRFLVWIIRGLLRTVCVVEDSQLQRVPMSGPLILVSNHINFLDAPMYFTHLRPRPMTALAKVELWHNPFLGHLFSIGNAIPLKRGEADKGALRAGLIALERGTILGIAPESTRSGDGKLLRGHPGITMLALRSGAPILPVVHHGDKDFWRNLRRLRRTPFRFEVGNPFYLRDRGVKVTRAVRQQMVDEIMYQIAALLPEDYRGYYVDMSQASEEYLEFPPGSQSNLLRSEGQG